MRSIHYAGFLLALCLTPCTALAQKQGQPEGFPSSWEHAEYILQTGEYRAVVEALNVCPAESEWNRNVMTHLLAPNRRTEEVIHFLTINLVGHIQTCGWEPSRAWLREGLLETTDEGNMQRLIRPIEDTFQVKDKELLLQFAWRAEVQPWERTMAFRAAVRNLNKAENVDWFFEIFEAGLLTSDLVSFELGILHTGETANPFAVQAAQSVVRHPEAPFAARVMGTVVRAAANDKTITRETASQVLIAMDQLARKEEFKQLGTHRAAVSRAARGGAPDQDH